MIWLTAPDGHPIWIAKTWVQVVRLPTPHEFAGPKVGAIVVLSGLNQAVQESVSEVISRLGGHNTDAMEGVYNGGK